jgi:hypothetical protein
VATRDDASGAAAAAAGAAATSLIPQTLEEMRGDAEGAATRDLLARRGQVSCLAAMKGCMHSTWFVWTVAAWQRHQLCSAMSLCTPTTAR